ncbi:MAG: peptidoglycan-binding domain-containing protein, partial [Polyangiaceae bacterium]
MLTLLDRGRTANAVAKNQGNSEALRLVAGLRRVFGLDEGDAFSEDLVQFIAEFQRSAGLSVDGEIGPKTMQKLDRLVGSNLACDALWAAPDAAVDQHEHFTSLLRVAGFTGFGPRPILLALRGVWLNGRLVHPVWHAPLYDDAFVLLQDGAPAFLFRGATHPYQRDSKASADLNGDGRKDVGMVRP